MSVVVVCIIRVYFIIVIDLCCVIGDCVVVYRLRCVNEAMRPVRGMLCARGNMK